MGRLAACILILTTLFLAACSTSAPTWRSKVTSLVEELDRQGAPHQFPQEYRNLLETFEHGEAVYHVQSNTVEADTYYQLAYQKAELLHSELRSLKQRLADEERKRKLALAAQIEDERIMREAVASELRLREQERIQVEEASKKALLAQKQLIFKEAPQQLPSSYTVRRGETLPQIAGRAEIYNDSSLWPLIYRANRDQIRDPKRLWPGQILSIPRHISRDDVLEARRYSGKK